MTLYNQNLIKLCKFYNEIHIRKTMSKQVVSTANIILFTSLIAFDFVTLGHLFVIETNKL